jgi:hypothetical protein
MSDKLPALETDPGLITLGARLDQFIGDEQRLTRSRRAMWRTTTIDAL